ncbi:MAG: hypothetical protein ACLQNE_11830 [Thermoguttaceae bacterium]|jgi:hypothetical protein
MGPAFERAILGLAAHYAPQLATYVKVWRDLTGQEVQEMGLLLTHPGCYVKAREAS